MFRCTARCNKKVNKKVGVEGMKKAEEGGGRRRKHTGTNGWHGRWRGGGEKGERIEGRRRRRYRVVGMLDEGTTEGRDGEGSKHSAGNVYILSCL